MENSPSFFVYAIFIRRAYRNALVDCFYPVLVNLVEAAKERVIKGEFDWLSVRKQPLDLCAKALPIILSPKIIHHQKAASQQVFA